MKRDHALVDAAIILIALFLFLALCAILNSGCSSRSLPYAYVSPRDTVIVVTPPDTVVLPAPPTHGHGHKHPKRGRHR